MQGAAPGMTGRCALGTSVAVGTSLDRSECGRSCASGSAWDGRSGKSIPRNRAGVVRTSHFESGASRGRIRGPCPGAGWTPGELRWFRSPTRKRPHPPWEVRPRGLQELAAALRHLADHGDRAAEAAQAAVEGLTDAGVQRVGADEEEAGRRRRDLGRAEDERVVRDARRADAGQAAAGAPSNAVTLSTYCVFGVAMTRIEVSGRVSVMMVWKLVVI